MDNFTINVTEDSLNIGLPRERAGMLLMQVDGDEEAVARLEAKFPTGALATLIVPALEALLARKKDLLAKTNSELEAERKRAEEALRGERDFRASLVEASPAFFVAIGPDGRLQLGEPGE